MKNKDNSTWEIKLYKNRYLILGLVVFLVFGNSIPNEYSLDDYYVADNPEVKMGIKALPEIFGGFYASVFEEGEQMSFGYRPLVKATFAIEYELFGKAPYISHFINLIIYCLILFLILSLLKPVFFRKHSLEGLAVVLLFAVHPIHTEVVASLKNRDELLSLLFGLLAMKLAVKYFTQKKYGFLLLAFLFYILGMISKISIVVFSILIPLYLNMFYGVKNWRLAILIITLVIITVLAKYLPNIYLPPRHRPKMFVENPMIFMTLEERVPGTLRILLFYLRKLFWPFPLLFYYGYNMVDVNSGYNLPAIFSFVVYLALFIAAVFYYKKNKKLSFGLLLYLVSVSIYTNLFKPAMGIVADRFLNLAVLGGILAAVSLVMGIKQLGKIVLIAFFVFFIVFSFASISRNSKWENQLVLMRNDIPKLEKSARSNYLFAASLQSKIVEDFRMRGVQPTGSQVDEILHYLQLAVQIYPEYSQAWNLMGNVAFSMKEDFDLAENCYKKSIQYKPHLAKYQLDLAYLYYYSKKYKMSEKVYLNVIKANPGNRKARKEISELYLTLGDTAKADHYMSQF